MCSDPLCARNGRRQRDLWQVARDIEDGPGEPDADENGASLRESIVLVAYLLQLVADVVRRQGRAALEPLFEPLQRIARMAGWRLRR